MLLLIVRVFASRSATREVRLGLMTGTCAVCGCMCVLHLAATLRSASFSCILICVPNRCSSLHQRMANLQSAELFHWPNDAFIASDICSNQRGIQCAGGGGCVMLADHPLCAWPSPKASARAIVRLSTYKRTQGHDEWILCLEV
jgi:hypothetical protein